MTRPHAKTTCSSFLKYGWTVVVQIAVCFAGLGNAQDVSCDPRIKAPASDPLRYELRGERCEGVFTEEFSAGIEVAFFRAGPLEDYDFNRPESLYLAWPTPNEETPVQIHARGIRRDITTYRMDYPPQGYLVTTTNFTWPLNIVKGLQTELFNKDISIVARTQLEDVQGQVYLPLHISQTEAAMGPANSYTLELLPGLKLLEVFVTIAPTKDDKTPDLAASLRYQEPLEKGPYPENKLFSVDIPFDTLPKNSWFYFVEITARTSSGPRSISFYFYHAEP